MYTWLNHPPPELVPEAGPTLTSTARTQGAALLYWILLTTLVPIGHTWRPNQLLVGVSGQLEHLRTTDRIARASDLAAGITNSV